jgi:hypothetical protein
MLDEYFLFRAQRCYQILAEISVESNPSSILKQLREGEERAMIVAHVKFWPVCSMFCAIQVGAELFRKPSNARRPS